MIKLCAFADEAASDLQGQIQALKRNNIAFIELRGINGKNVLDFSLDEAQEYYNTLQENGIDVWSIGSPLGKADIAVDINDYLDKVRHICKIANICNTQRVRMFSFHNAYEQREKVLDNLRKMVAVAREYGVVLCHENEKGIYGDTVERVCDILDSVEGLKFIYDPANFLQTDIIAEKTIPVFHERTEYFHIKDVIVETQELVPAGYGDGQIPTIIEKIKDDKVLTLEPHLMVFAGYENIDTTHLKHKFHFMSNAEAFDAAVVAIKKILVDKGYSEQGTVFVKEK